MPERESKSKTVPFTALAGVNERLLVTERLMQATGQLPLVFSLCPH